MVNRTDCEVYDLGDVALQHGVLPLARIAFKTHGTLNAAKDNVVLFPTWYSGQHPDVEWIIGEDFSLDPRRYFIVVVNIFGNGMSSSPSNQPPPYDRMRFPRVTILDNVKMQRRLLQEQFGIDRLRLVVGRSMGAQLAFQWGSYYPDLVENMLALAGSARTSPHNYVFLQSVKMALTSDPAWRNGEYDVPPVEGLNRMRLIFDSWGLSQTFYRQGLHLKLGFKSTDEFSASSSAGPAARCERLSCPSPHLGTCRHQRQRGLQEGLQGRAGRDQGAVNHYAVTHRPLFPVGGQRDRGCQYAECGIAGDAVDLGPSWRRTRQRPGRYPLPRSRDWRRAGKIMRPAPFRHVTPRSKGEACALLAKHGSEARVLAGGQSLVPLMNLRLARPAVLIDLNRCAELAFIERRDGAIAYGAMTRQIDAQELDLSKQDCSLISKALAFAGPLAIRSRGTIGGMFAHADRSAELPAVAVARDAIFVMESAKGSREVAAEAFFIDDLTTDIHESEMLCEIRFPVDEADAFSTFVEIGIRQRDMALAGLAAHINLNSDRTCRQARLALIGVVPHPAAPARNRGPASWECGSSVLSSIRLRAKGVI